MPGAGLLRRIIQIFISKGDISNKFFIIASCHVEEITFNPQFAVGIKVFYHEMTLSQEFLATC